MEQMQHLFHHQQVDGASVRKWQQKMDEVRESAQQEAEQATEELQEQLNDAMVARDLQQLERESDRQTLEEAMNAKLDELADLHEIHLEQQQMEFEAKLKELASDKSSAAIRKPEMRDATSSPPRPTKVSETATSPIVPSGIPPTIESITVWLRRSV